MTFSWKKARSDALVIKQRRLVTMLKLASNDTDRANPDFRVKHADDISTFVQTGKYDVMNKKCKEELLKKFVAYDKRIARRKIA